jgi:hypothetical protein
VRFLAAALLLAGCAAPTPELKIADVLADPSRYEEQTIELTGEVRDAFGLFSVGVYTLQDASGSIRVMTSRGLPAKGVKLTVRGTVSSGVTIGAEHYGVAVNEEERSYIEP